MKKFRSFIFGFLLFSTLLSWGSLSHIHAEGNYGYSHKDALCTLCHIHQDLTQHAQVSTNALISTPQVMSHSIVDFCSHSVTGLVSHNFLSRAPPLS